MIFRRVATAPDGTSRRLSPSFFVSLGVHVVVAIALMQMLILNGDYSSRPKPSTTREQRVGFVRLPQPGVTKPVAGQSGGDGRPFKSREIHVVAPTTVPSTMPGAVPPSRATSPYTSAA